MFTTCAVCGNPPSPTPLSLPCMSPPHSPTWIFLLSSSLSFLWSTFLSLLPCRLLPHFIPHSMTQSHTSMTVSKSGSELHPVLGTHLSSLIWLDMCRDIRCLLPWTRGSAPERKMPIWQRTEPARGPCVLRRTGVGGPICLVRCGGADRQQNAATSRLPLLQSVGAHRAPSHQPRRLQPLYRSVLVSSVTCFAGLHPHDLPELHY
jgi:hypothetical protein